MKIHHLNCGSMNLGFLGKTIMEVVLHCLLIDTGKGLVLVDTGWGMQDYENPTKMVSRFMRFLGSPKDINEAAIKQIERLGYQASDVKHIIMTHMHIDHAGGLRDFPQAKVHIFADEYQAIMNLSRFEKWVYVPEHWSHHPVWVIHTVEDEKWFNLDCTAAIHVGDTEFRMIPLIGHSRGHCGIAIRLDNNKWLLHAADTYTSYSLIDLDQALKLPGGIVKSMMSKIGLIASVFDHVPRLRNLRQELGDKLIIMCSHDKSEFIRYQNTIHGI